MEISVPQASPDVLTTKLDQLAEKFPYLSISDPTRTQEVTINQDSHSDMSPLSGLEIPSEVQDEDPIHFPLRLKNSASIYQDTISYLMQSKQEIPLTGAQRGLFLSITPEEGIVHWPGARPDTSLIDPSRLVGMVELLPYQDNIILPADNNNYGSTEILDIATTAESRTLSATRHSREVFMAG